MEKSNKSKQILLSVFGILSLIVITIGITYAIFTYTKLGTTDNTVTSGTLKFLYTENTGVKTGIKISNALPISDTQGKALDGDNNVFDFSIEATNTGTEVIPYEVTLRKKNTSTLAEENVKIYLTDRTETQETSLLEPTKYSELTQTSINVGNEIEKTIYKSSVAGGEVSYRKDFRLRMWIDETSNQDDINGKEFTAMVNVYANAELITEQTAYTESILNGTDPVLKDNLVPVTIASDGTVKKANIYTEWYNYENKDWANAVILKDETATYSENEVIPETAIESYFVWIPRYKYQIFDEGNYTGLTAIENKVQTINVVFENKDTAPSNGTTKNSWLTHPAFTSFDSNGFWVGKFETGYDGATSTAAAQVNSVDTSKIIIKPNVYSWRNMTVGNMFKNSYDYKRDLDSHMMKNTEWGAVAYLQHSTYGSQASVRINNNSAYITGYAGTEEPTKGYNGGTSIAGNRVESTALGVDGTYTVNYLNTNSGVASTTGNKTGIYDMSGGAWEYVAGYTTGATTVGGSSGITSLYSNFFTDSTYTKYWDKYTSTTNTNYNYRLLGDATGEMGPFQNTSDPDGKSRNKSNWYGDYAHFVYSSYPWFIRGGYWYSGSESGAFAFNNNAGGASADYSYRVVLSPTL
mgnify:CR=1 FL=1